MYGALPVTERGLSTTLPGAILGLDVSNYTAFIGSMSTLFLFTSKFLYTAVRYPDVYAHVSAKVYRATNYRRRRGSTSTSSSAGGNRRGRHGPANSLVGSGMADEIDDDDDGVNLKNLEAGSPSGHQSLCCCFSSRAVAPPGVDDASGGTVEPTADADEFEVVVTDEQQD